jgi:hypothetical protein
MATNKNFEVKNGLSVGGTERISSAGAFSGSLASGVTATTQSAADSSTKIATTAYTDAAITAVIGGAPGTLDTLNELASAINDDASYASTLTTALATKLPLAGGTMTGSLLVDAGDNGLDIRLGTDKRVTWSGGIGEIGSTAGFQAINTAGSALAAFGIRASELKFATGSATRLTIDATGNATFAGAITSSGAITATGTDTQQYRLLQGTAIAGGIFKERTITGAGVSNDVSIFAESISDGGEIHFMTGGSATKRVTIDSTGNVGIGTTPSTGWVNSTDFAALQIGSGLALWGRGSGDHERLGLTANIYHDGSAYKHIHTGRVTSYEQNDGKHIFKYHASQSAGTSVTLNTAMTIDTSGNVGIGTSSPVNNSNRTTLGLQGAWGGQLDIMVGSTVHAQFGTDNFSTGSSCRVQSADSIVFKTGSSGNISQKLNSDGYASFYRAASEYGMELKSAGTRSGLVIKKPATDTAMGSLLVLADESYRLGTGAHYHIEMLQNGYHRNKTPQGTYFTITKNFTCTGSSVTRHAINLASEIGASTGGSLRYEVAAVGYGSGGTNGVNAKYSVSGYSGHSYSGTNYGSFGAGTIQNGYNSSNATSYDAKGISYHPCINMGSYMANGEIWAYVPAGQQYGFTVSNNSSNSFGMTIIITGFYT